MCFESFNLHDIKKWQSTIYRKFESFSNKYLKFLSKYFAANEKEKLFPNDSSFISNSINAKTNTILTIKIKFLQTYFLACSNVPPFFTKKESVIILKMTNICRKSLAIFHNAKKERFMFLIRYLLLIFVNTECFFNI